MPLVRRAHLLITTPIQSYTSCMKGRDVDATKYHFIKTPYLRYPIRTRQRFEQLHKIIEESPLTTTELIARTGLKSTLSNGSSDN
jgi:hypothetical protein